MTSEENVNSNHAADRYETRSKRSASSSVGIYDTQRVKSKIVVPRVETEGNMSQQKVIFEEEGDMIQMEIDDGGAAEAEFASDEDQSESENEASDSEENEMVGSELIESSQESGEIETDTEPCQSQTSGDDSHSERTEN